MQQQYHVYPFNKTWREGDAFNQVSHKLTICLDNVLDGILDHYARTLPASYDMTDFSIFLFFFLKVQKTYMYMYYKMGRTTRLDLGVSFFVCMILTLHTCWKPYL